MVKKRFKIVIKFTKKELEFLKTLYETKDNRFNFTHFNFSDEEYFEICSDLVRKDILVPHSFDYPSKTIFGIKLTLFGKQLVKQL